MKQTKLTHAFKLGAAFLFTVTAAALANPDKVAYLGVATSPVDPTAGKQLGLPGGIGLAVDFVDPKGAAVECLQKHDVLYKLGDQLLVNHHQFAVLIRTHKAGEKVDLSIIREAKPQTVQVTLQERDRPPLPLGGMSAPQIHLLPPAFKNSEMGKGIRQRLEEALRDAGMDEDQLEKIFKEMNEDMPDNLEDMPDMPFDHMPEGERTMTRSAASTAVISDGELTITVTGSKGSQRQLEARNAEGDVIFKGPVNTEEEIDKLPPKVADLFKDMDQGPSFPGSPGKMEFPVD